MYRKVNNEYIQLSSFSLSFVKIYLKYVRKENEELEKTLPVESKK
jgi:hypothetical protein